MANEFVARNGLTAGNNSTINGTLTVTGNIIGTANTASYVLNAVSSSYAATASLLLGSVVSASYAATASYSTKFSASQEIWINGITIYTGSGTTPNSLAIGNAAFDTAGVTGDFNIAIGSGSLGSITTGIDNVAVGYGTLSTSLTGSYNVAMGYKAMGSTNNSGTQNVAVGYTAMQNNNGNNCVAVGYSSLTQGNSASNGNVGIGSFTLSNLTFGAGNMAIGSFSMNSATNCFNNVAIGGTALQFVTVGNGNVAIGAGSMIHNGVGSTNVGIGFNSLANISSSNNVAIGSGAGQFIANGSTINTNPVGSVFIGYGAYPLADSQTNQIVIGSGSIGLGTNTTVLGTPQTTLTYIQSTTTQIKHLQGTGSQPTIVAGTGAGTSPTVSVSGSDMAGLINITTGTSPAATNAIIGTITFATAYTNAPRVMVVPSNRAANLLSTGSAPMVPSAGQTNGVTTTTFVLEGNTLALAASTAYVWTYQIFQ